MKKFLLTCFALAVAFYSLAQERTVTGTVTSTEDGTPLPGVNVLVKGTTIGSATDANGKYSLSISATGGALVFSFIGLESKEIEIGDRTVVDVSLALDITQLTEVVVVGYGTQERRKVTSAISSVSGDQIAKLASPSFIEQLAGRTPGLQVQTGSGIIGQAPTVRIRGVNSITSGTSPLYVIDGIPMTTGNQSGVTPTNPLSDINQEDVESIEVLKDGAAAAIYGSRAANGVILITTKRGNKTKGKATVDFTITNGFNEAINRFDMANAAQFEEIANEKLANAGLAAAAFSDPSVSTSGETDWQDVILRRGRFSNYNISLGGASEATNYYVSAGYSFQESNVVANDFERFVFRTNADHRINKWVKFGTGINYTRSITSGLNTGSNALSGNVAGGLRAFPNVTVKDPNNATGFNLTADNQALGSGANTRAITSSWTNQAFVLANNKFDANQNRLMGNAYGQLDIIDGLTLKTTYGIDYLINKDFQMWDPRHGDGRGSAGIVFSQYRNIFQWTWSNVLNFSREFGDHSIDVTGGAEYNKTTIDQFNAQGTSFADRFFQQHGLISNTYQNQFSGGTWNQSSFESYFGRLNYGFKDRYLIGFSYRHDLLSRFSEEQRAGDFFGGSVGYRVSEENFFKNSVVANVVNEMKFRASYAEVGNTDIGGLFPYAGLYLPARYGSQNGLAFQQAGNPDLTWETATKLNIGADMTFLNNKLSVGFDYYENDVDGLVLDVGYAPSLGLPTAISQNLGAVTNRGLEFSVTATPLNKKGLVWTVSANFTTVKNEVLETFYNSAGQFAEINTGNYRIGARVGEPLGVLYGYEFAGVNTSNGFPMYEKGDGQIVQRNVATGVYSFYNPDDPTNTSNTTGAALSTADIANGGDRHVLGQTLPKYYGGLTNTFTYKGIALEIFARFSGGNMIYNQTRQDVLLNQDFTNSGTELLKGWTAEDPNTGYPRNYFGSNGNTFVNQSGTAISRFVEKGDFVKIQNIILSYSLPQSILDKTGEFKFRKVQVFGQVQNGFTFTKYKGIDPEMGGAQGVDNNTSPINRTITFGLNIGL
jgi:TonB-dependent starch-binding outer membrane protein SusC